MLRRVSESWGWVPVISFAALVTEDSNTTACPHYQSAAGTLDKSLKLPAAPLPSSSGKQWGIESFFDPPASPNCHEDYLEGSFWPGGCSTRASFHWSHYTFVMCLLSHFATFSIGLFVFFVLTCKTLCISWDISLLVSFTCYKIFCQTVGWTPLMNDSYQYEYH